jgi:hypothetical protein
MTEAMIAGALPAALDPLFGWIAAAGLAVLFAHAALAKSLDRPLFMQHLAAYGLAGRGLDAAALALPALEAATALLLLTPWREIGALLAGGLLLAYAAAMALHLARGRTLDCGCGGAPLPVSWTLVLRNLLLASVAGVATLPVSVRAMGVADFLVVAAAVVLGSLLYAALNQLLRHRAAPRNSKTLRSA